jgi:hypothetical protein
VVGETPDQGMPVVQVEMQVLADRADGVDGVEHIPCRAFDRGLDVCDQIRQPAVLRVKVPQAQPRMAAREPGRRLPHTDVAHVDAATDAFRVAKPLRHLHEPPRFQAGRVLEKDERAARPLTQTPIEPAHHAKQLACLLPHLMFVMDDEASDAACEAVGELTHHAVATLVQHIDAAIQMDHRKVRMRRHEPQNVLKLIRCVGIHLGGQAHLSEAEPGELEQRIVSRDASLE